MGTIFIAIEKVTVQLDAIKHGLKVKSSNKINGGVPFHWLFKPKIVRIYRKISTNLAPTKLKPPFSIGRLKLENKEAIVAYHNNNSTSHEASSLGTAQVNENFFNILRIIQLKTKWLEFPTPQLEMTIFKHTKLSLQRQQEESCSNSSKRNQRS